LTDEYLNHSIKSLHKYKGEFLLRNGKFVALVDGIHRAQKVRLYA
jgi:uncharacterized protein (DUF1330 family)